jgi:hypothetical protein
MSSGLIDVIKRASLDAMNNAQMCDLRFGTVTSTSPLKVQVTNRFTIPESLLIVPKHLTDYKVDVEIDWSTETKSGGSDYSAFASHNHAVTGTKTMTVKNALKVGDKVALLRKTGGQSYFILDRI